MSYNIIQTDNFNREVKQLAKKYSSIKVDLQTLKIELEANPELGSPLGKNVFKIRMAIASKGKGKSGGARVITYIYVQGERVFLLSIYDKSEKVKISNLEIKTYLKNLPL